MTTLVKSIGDVVDSFSQGLSQEKRDANFYFVANLHASLKEGGVWVSPALGAIYKRVGDGFEELAADVEFTNGEDLPNV